MAPKDGDVNSPIKKTKGSSQKLFSFFGLISSKNKNSKNYKEDVLEVDAIPGAPRNNSENISSTNTSTFEDKSPINNSHPLFENEQNHNDHTSESENNSKRKEKGYKSYFAKSKNNSDYRPTGIYNETNYNIQNATGLQIGDTYTYNCYNNMNINGRRNKQTKTQKTKKKTEVSEEMIDLCRSEDEVGHPHLQYLAKYFGASWIEIGKKLEIPSGELDSIEKRYADLKETSFQMLLKWSQMQGDNATVGNICYALLKSDIETARDAVHQMSLNMDLFE